MADRTNPYEAAFEAYVRSQRVPCVAVDEAKRSWDPDLEGTLKSPDFLLYPRMARNLIVEVKGKRGLDQRGRRPWECWVSQDDLAGLQRWQTMFGPGFQAILAFVYAEPAEEMADKARAGGAFGFRGRDYWFWAVSLQDYVEELRSRGVTWNGVTMAREAFRTQVRPLSEWMPMSETDRRRPGRIRHSRTRVIPEILDHGSRPSIGSRSRRWAAGPCPELADPSPGGKRR